MDESYIGEIRLFPFRMPLLGWLPCDGRSVAISEFVELYALIGITYGTAEAGLFRLPDLRGRVPLHRNSSRGGQSTLSAYELGEAGGEEEEARRRIGGLLNFDAVVTPSAASRVACLAILARLGAPEIAIQVIPTAADPPGAAPAPGRRPCRGRPCCGDPRLPGLAGGGAGCRLAFDDRG